ncbi:beta-galactosidase [Niveispirillum sp. SYP-B3756]|uniref:beta-galactosidase n=1 Tax=Niveispirillum sp. SYP-B3756 TaxID=2662178 RepID=UPI00129152F1|nr:beta-galactosidase [Niveispirillum sp. SYP-B3756]MQP67161.1 beta-galactosidase [Niveispirillum sp. SYP-B3756]
MLGVCYYPEHWPESWWRDDARRMKDLGLTYVRIGEFAWSRFEPDPGRYDFDWFDRALDVLGGAGLKVVACTPTATPPKWLVDKYPDILPVDPHTGTVRGFGSRRHYDFSSETYLRESNRITLALAERYGKHDAVAGWQTDNEISCHKTTLSISESARLAFRRWCQDRYGDIATLNEAWGNIFWSMEYRSFDEIDCPFLAVTETSPAHRMAFFRFSSDQVARFHQAQVDILRAHSPGRFITHNFIPMNETGVDNYKLAESLDFASYDNYPLGRTDLWMADRPAADFQRYMRTGHPDFGSFFFDQTRSLAGGKFWIMEQQPGPVNWAGHNPRPLPGMVRLWTLEAFAHGAEVVSYFRWRQAPFAQEQMHAGLLRPDCTEAEAFPQVQQVVRELAALDLAPAPVAKARVAIIADQEAQWLGEIERQGNSYNHTKVSLAWYMAARALGLDVDFIPPHGDPSGYDLILAPGLAMPTAAQVKRLADSGATLVFAPRCGAKKPDVTLPEGLPPGELRQLLPIRVVNVETTRPDCPDTLVWGNKTYESRTWREQLEVGDGAEVLARFDNGDAALVRKDKALYLASIVGEDLLTDLFESLCGERGIATVRVPPDMRLRRRGNIMFSFNYASEAQPAPAPAGAVFVLGGPMVGPRDVSVWKV